MTISEDVDTVLRELFQFHQDLARLNQTFYTFLAEGFRRPLIEGINGGLGYAARTGLVMPQQPDYVGYENLFHSWATIHAADELQAGTIERSYVDLTLTQELGSYPLFTNVNFLAQFPAKRLALPSLSAGRVVNLSDWAASSRAYLDLAYENRTYDDNLAPYRIVDLIRRGTELRTALGRIAKVDAATAPVKSDLFTRLLEYHAALNTSLQQQLQAEQAKFLEGKSRSTDLPAALNLWGGLQQSTGSVPPPLTAGTIGRCGGAGGISTPSGVASWVPRSMLVQAVLEPSKVFSVCYAAEWVDSVYYNVDPTTQGRRSKPQVTVRVYFGGKLLSAKTKKFADLVPEWSRGLNQWPDVDAHSYVAANWTSGRNYRPMFDSSATFSGGDSGYVTSTENAIRARFARIQGELYTELASKLTMAGPLGDAGRALDGNKSLIGAYAALGLPNALRNYDELRALLFGTGYGIADSSYYRTAYTNPTTDPLTNQLTLVTNESALLRGRLSDALKVVFDALQSGELQERNELLENTLQELQTQQITKLDRLAGVTVSESHGVTSGQAQTSFKMPTFTWTQPSNAAGHELYFGSDPEGRASGVVSPIGGVYTYSPAPAGVTNAVSYLRMRVRDTQNNWGTWQTLFTFVYNPLCPVAGSTFDGTKCFVGLAPVGTQTFLWDNNLYHTPATPGSDCPAPGSTLVGGECFVTAVPAGTNPFAWGPSQATGLYYTPLPGSVCPLLGSGFDGANCFVMRVPNGSYGIAHDGKLFYAAMPQRCPLPGSGFDGANCFVATPPAGTTPIISERTLAYTPLMGP